MTSVCNKLSICVCPLTQAVMSVCIFHNNGLLEQVTGPKWKIRCYALANSHKIIRQFSQNRAGVSCWIDSHVCLCPWQLGGVEQSEQERAGKARRHCAGRRRVLVRAANLATVLFWFCFWFFTRISCVMQYQFVPLEAIV